MSLRVTQGIMYSSMVHNMNRNLSAYMESNMQSSSQKRVNKPSDDPVSAGRILGSRHTLSRLSVYEENAKTAMGWLATADSILTSGDGSVHNVLSMIKTKDIQTSTGTINQENRMEVASAIRQYMSQLVSLANTPYGKQYIFAGQKTDTPPYEEVLGMTVKDPEGNLDGVQYNVVGSSTSTIMIAPVGTAAGQADSFGPGSGTGTYAYSTDGGKTWQEVNSVTTNPATGGLIIDTGIGVTVEMSDPTATVTPSYDTINDLNNPTDSVLKTGEGTWMYVRPTAQYRGDDKTTQVTAGYRPTGANGALAGEASGHFTRDVAVRLDSIDSSVTPPRLYYSFSTDNGSNWSQASSPMPTSGNEPVNLPVPGGYISVGEMTAAGPPPSYTLPAAADMGTQYVIHPHRADINYQIGDTDYITVNMVGKDIFGGLYNRPENTAYPYPEVVSGPNMFETLGKLVAGLETNDEEMVSQCLDELDEVMSLVRTRTAEVGGREERLIVTQASLVMRTYSEEDNLSQMEDIDVSELMTRLAQQQIAYNSVLKSSSMIMQMSLVNFL